MARGDDTDGLVVLAGQLHDGLAGEPSADARFAGATFELLRVHAGVAEAQLEVGDATALGGRDVPIDEPGVGALELIVGALKPALMQAAYLVHEDQA